MSVPMFDMEIIISCDVVVSANKDQEQELEASSYFEGGYFPQLGLPNRTKKVNEGDYSESQKSLPI